MEGEHEVVMLRPKRCSRCKETKIGLDFSHKGRVCKVCVKESNKKHRGKGSVWNREDWCKRLWHMKKRDVDLL